MKRGDYIFLLQVFTGLLFVGATFLWAFFGDTIEGDMICGLGAIVVELSSSPTSLNAGAGVGASDSSAFVSDSLVSSIISSCMFRFPLTEYSAARTSSSEALAFPLGLATG